MSEERPGTLRRFFKATLIVFAVAAAFALGRSFRRAERPPSQPSELHQVAEHLVQLWTCSMHPQIQQPKPGKCPLCGMDLIPVADETRTEPTSPRTLTLSAAAKALMEIETSPVERRSIEAEVRMVGKVAYDETRLGYIPSRVKGRLDRLYVDYTGMRVARGDQMVEIYSPDLVTAQQELLQARRTLNGLQSSDVEILREATQATVVAAREKLQLMGLTRDQILEIEQRGTPTDRLTIYAPMGGIVVEKNARVGMYVDAGTILYTIADLSSVWIKLDAYESDLIWLRCGQHAEITVEAYPGEVFHGTVSFIEPTVDPSTRTLKVRVEVPNEEGKLKPEMFVRALVRSKVAADGRAVEPAMAGKWVCPMHPQVAKDGPGKCDVCNMALVERKSADYAAGRSEYRLPLVIPASAPLITGARAVVYVEKPGTEKPTYEGREVQLGPRAGDYYIVRAGLEEGERVVTKGNFKIDSSLQIQAKPSMMRPEGGDTGTGHQHGAAQTPVDGGSSHEHR